MRNASEPARRNPAGFTLIELAIVVLIIGLIIILLATASAQGLQRAQIRATQALITKLETGMVDRVEALLSQRADANDAHKFLALSAVTNPNPPPAQLPLTADARAQAIARSDLMKREVPDVFFVQVNPATLAVTSEVYPFNFAAQPYPGTVHPQITAGLPSLATFAHYVLPLGNCIGNDYNPGANTGTSFGAAPTLSSLPADYRPSGEGIFGASYDAQAALLKNLGNIQPTSAIPTPKPINPQGYDRTDNDGDGLIDEFAEGVDGTNLASVVQALQNHTHKTARSEMLYALLVEGVGPLGSVFTRDDFTDREVADTDNDGLPEFIDAWGEPLQFYRWPIHYSGLVQGSSLQKGLDIYNGAIETRQLDPLDPSNQLVGPLWWSADINVGVTTGTGSDPFITGTGNYFGSAGATTGGLAVSGHAFAFMNYFHSLVDFNQYAGSAANFQYWDRGNYYGRRAYFSKFLIVSSGPDKQLGIAQVNFNYGDYDLPATGGLPAGSGVFFGSSVFGSTVDANAKLLILVEDTASSLSPSRQLTPPYYPPDTAAASAGIQTGLQTAWGLDDISNQMLQATGGATR